MPGKIRLAEGEGLTGHRNAVTSRKNRVRLWVNRRHAEGGAGLETIKMKEIGMKRFGMKKYNRILLLCALIMAAAVLAAGCGGGDDKESDSPEKERAAEKYAKVLTDKNGTYYLKVESGEETSDSADIFKDTQVMAQEGTDKKYVSSEANNSKQYYMDDKLYYYDGNAKTYYVMNQGAKGDDTNDAYAPAESYKKTKEKKFDGQQMECDIYENETTEEGIELINRTEYYVDDKGDLRGIISEQLNKSSMKLVSRVTMDVLKFETKIPEGTFTRPDGYEEIKEEDH